MDYFISIFNPKTGTHSKEPVIDPHPFEIEGISVFAHRENLLWKVTEKTTGTLLFSIEATNKTDLNYIKEYTKKFILKYSPALIKQQVSQTLSKIKFEQDIEELLA